MFAQAKINQNFSHVFANENLPFVRDYSAHSCDLIRVQWNEPIQDITDLLLLNDLLRQIGKDNEETGKAAYFGALDLITHCDPDFILKSLPYGCVSAIRRLIENTDLLSDGWNGFGAGIKLLEALLRSTHEIRRYLLYYWSVLLNPLKAKISLILNINSPGEYKLPMDETRKKNVVDKKIVDKFITMRSRIRDYHFKIRAKICSDPRVFMNGEDGMVFSDYLRNLEIIFLTSTDFNQDLMNEIFQANKLLDPCHLTLLEIGAPIVNIIPDIIPGPRLKLEFRYKNGHRYHSLSRYKIKRLMKDPKPEKTFIDITTRATVSLSNIRLVDIKLTRFIRLQNDLVAIYHKRDMIEEVESIHENENDSLDEQTPSNMVALKSLNIKKIKLSNTTANTVLTSAMQSLISERPNWLNKSMISQSVLSSDEESESKDFPDNNANQNVDMQIESWKPSFTSNIHSADKLTFSPITLAQTNVQSIVNAAQISEIRIISKYADVPIRRRKLVKRVPKCMPPIEAATDIKSTDSLTTSPIEEPRESRLLPLRVWERKRNLFKEALTIERRIRKNNHFGLVLHRRSKSCAHDIRLPSYESSSSTVNCC